MAKLQAAADRLTNSRASSHRVALRQRKSLRGYLLLSPTLALMAAMMAAPLAALVIISFWTQQNFDIDVTPSLRNYRHLIEPSGDITYWFGIPFRLAHPVYAILLAKSVLMSLAVTAAVIMVAYPMAYFLAFRVRQHKTAWLILITVPLWTSYLLRVFAWKVVLGYNGAITSGLISLG